MQHYIFSQIDSWFFRESRSMDGSGATALDSIFPPANQTLFGALRTQIGERYLSQHNGHWGHFDAKHPLANIIGYGQDCANLTVQGAWLYHDESEQLYFPAPANLVQQDNRAGYDFFTLPQEPLPTDLGNIRLPQLKERMQKNEQNEAIKQRDKPLEQYWLSCTDYRRVLRGEVPQAAVKQNDIFTDEPRLGISRDNQTRRTEDGMLYQTKHLRLENGWHVYLGLDGVTDDYRPINTDTKTNTEIDIILRLGGEARMASLHCMKNTPALPEAPAAKGQILMLYLLTPLPDRRSNGQIPPLPAEGFERQNNGSYDYWHGNLHGVAVNILSAIVGKLQRIGGWDMVNHRALPVRSYLPAGSCWYLHCDSREQAQAIINTLHLQYLTTGTDRAQGYGQVAVGITPTVK